MGRIRCIKPETPHSESMGRVSREARLLFILLWTIFDDEGRARGNSRMLASLLYPYDSDAPQRINAWLRDLEKESMIVRYQAGGDWYICAPKWLTHQRIDHPTKSKLPAPPDVLANAREVSRILAPDMEGIGEDKEGKDSCPKIARGDFERFWDSVPRKVRKETAKKAYEKALTRAPHELILAGVKLYATSRAGEDERYTAHPATWLNGDGWLDQANGSAQSAAVHDPKLLEIAEQERATLATMGIKCS